MNFLFSKKRNRHQNLNLSAFIGIFSNLILFIMKLSGGLISGSIALISDAFNNLFDFSNSIITLITNKLTQKPADEDHPFGHGRTEYIGTQFISFLILFIGINLLFESIDKIRNPQPFYFSLWFVLILISSIMIKWLMVVANKRIYQLTQSDLIEAVILDSKLDVYSSILLLIALWAQQFIDFPIDGIAGVILSALLIYQGILLLKNTLSKLLGRKLSSQLMSEIDAIINEHPEILGYHNLKGHDYGPNHIHVSIDIELPDTMNLVDAHRIVDSIERELNAQLNIDSVCHIDPISSDLALQKEMHQLVLDLGVDELSINKLYCVRGHYRTSIFLDLNIQDKEAYKKQKESVIEKAKRLDENVSFHFSLNGKEY